MKILAIQLNQPGDAILTTPALRWWINGGHEVHVLVQPVSAQLLDTMPGLAGIYPLLRETYQIGRDIRRWRKFSKMGFDWAVVFSHSSERPSLWAFLSGAPKRTAVVLPKFPHLLRQTGWITEWMHHPDWATHTVQEHMALAGAPAREAGGYDLEYSPSKKARLWHDEWLLKKGLLPGKYIHFHLTSRLMEKCWPAEHARKFIQLLPQLSMPLVVTTGPDLFERQYGREVLSESPKAVKELGTLQPHQLGAIIEKAGAFVGMDSMPMHLAAALGTPGVSLFGPSDPVKWSPWHSPISVVHSESLASMDSLNPTVVFQALQESLERSRKQEVAKKELQPLTSFFKNSLKQQPTIKKKS